MNNRRVFYPNEKVEEILKMIPKGKISSRINDFILKGIIYERILKIKEDYTRFNEEIGLDKPNSLNSNTISDTMIMSKKAFDSEDEEEDYI